VITKNAVFWIVLPSNFLQSHKHFREHAGSIFRNYNEVEAVSSSEVYVPVYQTTWRHIQIESNHQMDMNFQKFSRIRLLMMLQITLCVCVCVRA
jgi:CRISPR/Cas system-associated protein Cas5 (RAMP superfamily)